MSVDASLWLSPNRSNIKQPRGILDKHKRPQKPTAPIIPQPGDYQTDIMFMPTYKRSNNNKDVIIVLIHTATRFIYADLVKNKTEAQHKFIELTNKVTTPIKRLFADAGTEFINNKIKNHLKNKNVQLVIVNKSQQSAISPYVMSIVERLNKTIRDLIERWITLNGPKYSTVFQGIINLYNNTVHDSLKQTPNDAEQNITNDPMPSVTPEILNRTDKIRQTIRNRFPLNSYVREMQTKKTAFTKSATPKFSDEVYQVVGYQGYRVILRDKNNPVYHTVVYHQLVNSKPDNTTFTSAERKELQRQRRIDNQNIREFGPAVGHEVTHLDPDNYHAPVFKEQLKPKNPKRIPKPTQRLLQNLAGNK